MGSPLAHHQTAAAPEPLVSRILLDFEELAGIRTEWERLRAACCPAQAFNSWGWIEAFGDAYGDSLELCIVTTRRADRVVGILPLAIDGDRLKLLGDPVADYGELLCDDDDPAAVLRSALAALELDGAPRWRTGRLEGIPEDSLLGKTLAELEPSSGGKLLLEESHLCPTLLLASDRNGVLTALQAKKSLRRHRRLLERRGTVSFRHLCDSDEIREHLPRFFEMHRSRRAVAGGDSFLADRRNRRFCEALTRRLDPVTELRFSMLTVDSRPVAYHLGFQAGKKLSWYAPAFDVDWWREGPGEVLLAELLEYANDERLDEIDFTVGEEQYKRRFTNHERRNRILYLERGGKPRSRRWIRLREKLSHYRVLSAAARRTRGAWRQLRGAGSVAGLGRVAWSFVEELRPLIVARTTVLVYRHEPAAGEEDLPPVSLRHPGLRELALLREQHPDRYTRLHLERARRRLGSGDRVNRAGDGELLHEAWSGTREEIVPSEVGPKCRLPLPEPGLLVYDCWTPPAARGRGHYPAVLAQLCAETRERGQATWIYCLEENHASRRGIERAGFRPRHRLTRWRFLTAFDLGRCSTWRVDSGVSERDPADR